MQAKKNLEDVDFSSPVHPLTKAAKAYPKIKYSIMSEIIIVFPSKTNKYHFVYCHED